MPKKCVLKKTTIYQYSNCKKVFQLELKKIGSSINNYNPTKIFVEWPYKKQKELDSLYQLYINDEYFKNENLSNFNQKNEIFQLAFRVAKENKLEKVYAIDYTNIGGPFAFSPDHSALSLALFNKSLGT